MIEDLNAKIQELNNELFIVKEKYRIELQEIIKELFNDFLKKYEGIVEYVQWRQYTPGWNDGDATYFSLGDLYLKIFFDENPDDSELSSLAYPEEIERMEEKIVQWHEYYENRLEAIKKYGNNNQNWKPSWYGLDECEEILNFYKKQEKIAPNLSEDFDKLRATFVMLDEEVMQTTFGDPVSVRVELKDGTVQFNIEEYESY